MRASPHKDDGVAFQTVDEQEVAADDPAWDSTNAQAQHWQLVEWLAEVDRLVIVELGVGTAIPTLRDFGDQLVQRRGATRIRINPRDFETHDPNSIGISAGAVESLSAIDRVISARQ